MTEGLLVPVLARGGPRIVVEIHNGQPVDLLDLTSSLNAFSREYEANLKRSRPELDSEESRLLIVDVRKGSIVFEIAVALAPFVAQAEILNTTIDFVKNLKSALSFLEKPNGRLEDTNAQQLKNLHDTVKSIANDANGHLNIYVRHEDGRVTQEIVIRKKEAINVQFNAMAQRKEIGHQESERLNKVLMRLHQSSVEDLRLGKRTSEKGVVERIDLNPRTLIYVSDHAGRIIKGAISDQQGNPFQKAFVVDVDVETVNGRPRAYRILEVYEVIDLLDD